MSRVPENLGETQFPIRVIERGGHVWLHCIAMHEGGVLCDKRLRLAEDAAVLNGMAIQEMVTHAKENARRKAIA